MTDVDEYVARLERRTEKIPLIPDPDPRPRHWPFVSVDDHLLEPANTFEGRLPRHLQDRAPRIIKDDNGIDTWLFEDEKVAINGGNVMRCWEPEHMYAGAIGYDEIRPGTYDVHERIRDMDIGGIYASLCFPSMVFGFAGWRFMKMKDPELKLATLRAYNQWILEEWAGAYPDRLIPAQVSVLWDAELAAKEIRANAERGFHAVTFSENPETLGLPSLYSGYWDPFFQACEETGTVVNLHVGSSGATMLPSKDSPLEVLSSLFTVSALGSAIDWIYTLIPVRFPNLKLVLSEGGLGWIPMLLDRLLYQERYYVQEGLTSTWDGIKESPREVFLRNFWFTAYFDPSTIPHLPPEVLAKVMYESDYPHADSSWPDTQSMLMTQFDGLSDEAIEGMTFRTACELYSHPLPNVSEFIAGGPQA